MHTCIVHYDSRWRRNADFAAYTSYGNFTNQKLPIKHNSIIRSMTLNHLLTTAAWCPLLRCVSITECNYKLGVTFCANSVMLHLSLRQQPQVVPDSYTFVDLVNLAAPPRAEKPNYR